MSSNPLTVDERLRRCESTLALIADLGALAAMRGEYSLSSGGLHALAELSTQAAILTHRDERHADASHSQESEVFGRLRSDWRRGVASIL